MGTVTAELVYLQSGRDRLRRNEYHMHMWNGARRRWPVAGVLVALALAVLAPGAGAQGGKHCMLCSH